MYVYVYIYIYISIDICMYVYIYISPNSFSASVGALLEPCARVVFYRVSRAKSSFLVPDPHKHVTFATLAHGSVANSVRIESHLASLSCHIPFSRARPP